MRPLWTNIDFSNITDLFIVESAKNALKRNIFWKFISPLYSLKKLMWTLFLGDGTVDIGWIPDISYLHYCKNKGLC
jgi:hypothetical protein